jgi:ElaB/YqjD/DUF883 family membrane-anchored ribosome-binding protein
MDQDRSGGGSNSTVKSQEPFTKAFGEVKDQVGDLADQVGSAAQDLYGQARDSASQVVDAAGKSGAVFKKSASSIEDAIRHTIENKPYTAVAIALGIGWLFGRRHSPL